MTVAGRAVAPNVHSRFPSDVPRRGRNVRLTSTPALRSRIVYVYTFAATVRAIPGLSRQTPSPRMTVRRIEHGRPDEIQHRAIDLRPLWLY
jgi:hypothetical protein